MYLLDGGGGSSSSSSPEPGPATMQRGTPQRKTVYRISVTMVKKELLQPPSPPPGTMGDAAGTQGPGAPRQHQRRRRLPTTTASLPRGGLLVEEAGEDLAEEEDSLEEREGEDRVPSPRSFRTRSTGQLELGRLKVPGRPECFQQGSLSGRTPHAEAAEPSGCRPRSPSGGYGDEQEEERRRRRRRTTTTTTTTRSSWTWAAQDL
ncbi:uncharacterized protein LOC144457457 [Phascolarctos cinereus]